jgi:hypothetical protein
MQFKTSLLISSLLLSANAFNVQASLLDGPTNIISYKTYDLTSYTAGGIDLVRMQSGNFDVSWTKDGNLLGTLQAGNPGLVSSLISDTAPINGHTLTTADFGNNGLVSWFGAQAFIQYLNNSNYGGSNQWRLPGWMDNGVAGLQGDTTYLGDGFYGPAKGGDYGYDVNVNTSEMATLYYAKLGKKSPSRGLGLFNEDFGIFGNGFDGYNTSGSVGPFNNVHSARYWFSTEEATDPRFAWIFDTSDGQQGTIEKGFQFYAWAIRPGINLPDRNITTVPLPGTVWLFGVGMAGLLGLKRRISAS